MILLDANVISEPLKSKPDPRLARWIDEGRAEEDPMPRMFLPVAWDEIRENVKQSVRRINAE